MLEIGCLPKYYLQVKEMHCNKAVMFYILIKMIPKNDQHATIKNTLEKPVVHTVNYSSVKILSNKALHLIPVQLIIQLYLSWALLSEMNKCTV